MDQNPSQVPPVAAVAGFNQQSSTDAISRGEKRYILVTGRVGADKTALLRKLCGVSYEPTEKEYEIPRSALILHDSAGFNGWSDPNFGVVQTLLKQRAKTTSFSERIHAIWYCIRTDTHLYLSSADQRFFNEGVAGDAPVIVIFTKYHGLVTMAFGELRKTLGRVESKAKRFERADVLLQDRYIQPLKAMAHPPLHFVRIGDLSDEKTSCEELLQTMQQLLSSDAMKPILFSVRQTNIDACIAAAVEDCLGSQHVQDIAGLLAMVLPHFPHVWRDEQYEGPVNHGPDVAQPHDNLLTKTIRQCASILSHEFTDVTVWTNTKRAEVVAAACICIEQTSMDTRAPVGDFPAAFGRAVDAYFAAEATVRQAVNKEITKFAPQDYRREARVDGPVYPTHTQRATLKLVEIITSNRLRLATPGPNPGR